MNTELPDVEAMVVAFLDSEVEPLVTTRVPKTRPDLFARAWRTGGAAVNRVLERAQITVTAWGKSENDTVAPSKLARECRGLLLGEYTSMLLVRGVEEVSGLYFDPDPTTGIARYTFTVSLMVRAKRTA